VIQEVKEVGVAQLETLNGEELKGRANGVRNERHFNTNPTRREEEFNQERK